MRPRLWGRAESVRSVFRGALEATAPVTFGVVADAVFGGGQRGLEYTFLVMLIPLLAAGPILLVALRSYTRDVATADASLQTLEEPHPEPGPGDEPWQQPEDQDPDR